MDVISKQRRSEIMAKNRAKDTSPELYLHRLLGASGLTYTRHDSSLPGKPDFVFSTAKVAVFVDGDFWHGWRFPLWKHRMKEFWREKISNNRARDARNFRRLRRMGWTVVRVWEHQIEENLIACVRRIGGIVRQPVNWLAVEAERSSLPVLKRRKRLPKP